MSATPATYQATEQLNTLAEDTTDLTNVTVQVGAPSIAAETDPCHCGGGIVARLAHSATVKYLAVLASLLCLFSC